MPPALLDGVRQRLQDAGLASLTLIADRTLADGQARLTSPAAAVELDVEAQLQAVREALLPHALPERQP